MKKIRCFLAVEMSGEIAGMAAALIDQLSQSSDDVKWAAGDALHLTLKFFGDIDELETYEISKAVQRVAETTAPFDARLRGVGAFPALDRPRTIWAGFEAGRELLVDLQQRIDAALADVGYPPERRPFHPHITLGRVREKGAQPAIIAALRDRGNYDGGCVGIDELTLYRSELQRHGPVYTTLATIALTG